MGEWRILRVDFEAVGAVGGGGGHNSSRQKPERVRPHAFRRADGLETERSLGLAFKTMPRAPRNPTFDTFAAAVEALRSGGSGYGEPPRLNVVAFCDKWQPPALATASALETVRAEGAVQAFASIFLIDATAERDAAHEAGVIALHRALVFIGGLRRNRATARLGGRLQVFRRGTGRAARRDYPACSRLLRPARRGGKDGPRRRRLGLLVLQQHVFFHCLRALAARAVRSVHAPSHVHWLCWFCSKF